ncbi:MAG: AraC family transcriptional regulator [Alistipes sp.]|nr:AraC family transcriptional regulator [Alistipes sp.]
MAENKIFPYKVDALKLMDGVEYVACKNGALMHISSLDRVIASEMKYPAKLNGYIAILCASGEVSLSVQMNEYVLKSGSLLVAPASVVMFSQSVDCELYIMAFSAEFAVEMNIDIKVVLPIISSLHNSAVIRQLTPEQITKMSHSFAAIYKEYSEPKYADVDISYYREMSMRHMYAAIIYRLWEFIAVVNQIDVTTSSKDRSGDYFKQLVSLLHEHYRTERSVEFYANQMNLTPKHLSRVVRNHSGKSVHQWIDEFVVLEIKNLLKYSDLSIQQISYELNFPNPSFMGQYFKRITGKTPGHYRREL